VGPLSARLKEAVNTVGLSFGWERWATAPSCQTSCLCEEDSTKVKRDGIADHTCSIFNQHSLQVNRINALINCIYNKLCSQLITKITAPAVEPHTTSSRKIHCRLCIFEGTGKLSHLTRWQPWPSNIDSSREVWFCMRWQGTVFITPLFRIRRQSGECHPTDQEVCL